MELATVPLAPIVAESIRFPAGAYQLEGVLAYPETDVPFAAAVVAGPQPLLGGDLNNNVVRALGDGLAERGLATLRFNYRGVGRSEGPPVDPAAHLAEFWRTSHVADELDARFDLQGAVACLRGVVGPELPLAVIGYSFGCLLLPHVWGGEAPLARVLVAPTVARHDYSIYRSLKEPMLVVASQGDFAAPDDSVRRWFAGLEAPRRLVHLALDNHFFRGHEPWLVQTVADFLGELWGEPT
jgi:alpha/beta superfamily hydrolase